VFFQTGDVSQKLLAISHAHHVPTNHFIGCQGRLFARPQADEQAGDNGAVGLNLNAPLGVTQQMAAAKNLFEEAKEDLRLPAIMPPKTEAYIWP
jgi:hypothetical protein